MNDPLKIDYASLGIIRNGRLKLAKALGVAGCITGAAATLFPLWPLWGFYNVPVGTSMRPMGLTLILAIFAAFGLLVAFPLSIACFALDWRHRSIRWIALIGILLSISATCLNIGLFNWIVAVRHFVLED